MGGAASLGSEGGFLRIMAGGCPQDCYAPRKRTAPNAPFAAESADVQHQRERDMLRKFFEAVARLLEAFQVQRQDASGVPDQDLLRCLQKRAGPSSASERKQIVTGAGNLLGCQALNTTPSARATAVHTRKPKPAHG